MTARVMGSADVVAVICGAREWPGMGERFAPAAAFANTAAGLRDYLHSVEGLGLAAADLLWLFDSPATAVEHLDRIHTFLTARTTRSGATHGRGLVVVFAYVGHGAFFGGERAYSLLLRDTREPVPAETSLRVASVASMLRATVPESARIVILDACFAGVAFKDFQSDLTQLSAVKIIEALEHSHSTRGVALLCAASARNPARLAGADTTTLFGRALLDVLHTGDPDIAGPMSLRRIGELTTRRLTDHALDHAPTPEVHAPDQHHGDLAAKPLFPNPATPAVTAALPEALRAGLEHPYPEFRRAAVERLATWLTSPDPMQLLAASQHLHAIAANDHSTVATLARHLLDQATTASPPDTHTTTLTGHTDWVRAVAFSPDGRLLATGSDDRTVRLWDPATGHQVGDPLGHTNLVFSVAFSPDRRLLATGSGDGSARLWDPATGHQVGDPLTGHTGAVRSVAFSPDGRLLATGDDRTVQLWDPATGHQVGDPLTGHTGAVLSVAFCPDGRLLATGDYETVQLWDPVTGHQVGDPLGHTNLVFSVAFSPDRRLLATGDDRTVRLWDAATGHQVGDPLTGHTGAVRSVAFSPYGRLLATSSADKTVRLWDPATGHQVGDPLTGHTGLVGSVAFGPAGRLLATGSHDGTVRLWEARRS
ncbi:WD40 repeat domain-containing protein [Nocardia abscessus]|uniref:WD40 repeat domain-containing protein n=2 Tax=Nocardia abscessus TaxID=120957 RepID=UPI001D143BA1|nr:WD40 repeat domain-containing protein [Nocardia abscessus]MCC3332030.1 WD40 repeat domain-containing protein [Nocardia abscessus]